MQGSSSSGASSPTTGLLRSRSAALAFVLAHGVLVWGAFFLRVDRFPLTWAPMYTVLRPGPVLATPVWDRDATLTATRRDGRVESLDADTLNIPRLSFWRLYTKRMLGRGPAKHDHDRVEEPWDRTLRGALGVTHEPDVTWDRRILESVNGTLGRAPDDPDFIVQIDARMEQVLIDRRSPDNVEQRTLVASARWHEPEGGR